MGLGGVLSNALFGWVAHAMGFNASFIGLSLVAGAGGVLYGIKMPETKEAAENRQASTASAA
jgi:sugar phosphate permease